MVELEITASTREAVLNRLRQALKMRGISFQEASENAHLGEQYVSRVSRGTSNPSLTNLIQICVCNDIELFELFLEDHEVEYIKASRSFQSGVPTQTLSDKDVATILQAQWAQRLSEEKRK